MKEGPITVKEILNMPGDNAQVELVNGKIISCAKTTTNHQLIVGELMQIIYRHLKLQETYGEVLTFVPTILDDYNMFLPDLLVVSDKEKIDNDKGCVGVPDWIIEIANPESREMDYFIKTEKYMRAGEKEYWIVDYEKQKVLVHNFLEYDTSIFSFQNTIKGRAINEVAIDFKEISSCLLQDQEENKKYNVNIICPSCSKRSSYEISLTEEEQQRLDDVINKNGKLAALDSLLGPEPLYVYRELQCPVCNIAFAKRFRVYPEEKSHGRKERL